MLYRGVSNEKPPHVQQNLPMYRGGEDRRRAQRPLWLVSAMYCDVGVRLMQFCHHPVDWRVQGSDPRARSALSHYVVRSYHSFDKGIVVYST